MAGMEQGRRLSLRLYDTLESVGASEKMRKLHRRIGTTMEILLTLRYIPESVDIYKCGSSYEGSVTPDLRSDTDIIECSTYPPVSLDSHNSPPGFSLLVIRDEWTYPGYVKLQSMVDGLLKTRYNAMLNPLQSFDENGRLCFLHYRGRNMQGPADMGISADGIHVVDNVMALQCNTLPLFASDRLVLLSRRNVISDEECAKLNETGCMFVGAGYFLSSEKEIEWRISFCLQERHIMSKLNPTQHKVYILLKIIKRHIIEKVTDCGGLTSYHCKTCVLYAVEMTSARAWTPDNLINCLLQCIKLLVRWLKRGYCPNFFSKDQNLFSKEGFSRFRNPILQTMETLLLKNTLFLRLLEAGHVGDILKEGESRFRDIIDIQKNELICWLKYETLATILTILPSVLKRFCCNEYGLPSLVNALESLQQTQTITIHTAVETQAALGCLIPWFHLHIANGLACLSYRCHNRYKKQMIKAADFHFYKADMTDVVNVRLAKASVLYKAEQYEHCFGLLQTIENDCTYKMERLCPCFHLITNLYRSPQEIREYERTVSRMSIKNFMKTYVACCVIFLPSEFCIIPTPLQYEMFRSHGTQPGSRDEDTDFWFDWCVTDAKVYLYLLQYLVSTKLQKEAHKQVSMDNIRTIIEEDNLLDVKHYAYRQLGHRETAYNLLGWINMQERRYGDAIQCFLRSWEIRPFHNAAQFHMRDLSVDLLQLIFKYKTRVS